MTVASSNVYSHTNPVLVAKLFMRTNIMKLISDSFSLCSIIIRNVWIVVDCSLNSAGLIIYSVPVVRKNCSTSPIKKDFGTED